MARIRTIKPDFWRDENLATISPEAALLAIGLLNHADDDGYFNANPKLIESDIFPLRELSRTITVMVDELFRIGYIQLFQGVDGKRYGHICNFAKHQVINKKNPSKIKDLCTLPDNYCTPTVELPVGMEGNGNGKEREWKASQRATSVACPTDVSQQIWNDWVALRKSKKAPITQTVLNGAIAEAKILGWPLEKFLAEWCSRGSQGLKAEWIVKPNPADKARLTVASSNQPDPALLKIAEDAKKAVPIPLSVLAKMAELRRNV